MNIEAYASRPGARRTELRVQSPRFWRLVIALEDQIVTHRAAAASTPHENDRRHHLAQIALLEQDAKDLRLARIAQDK